MNRLESIKERLKQNEGQFHKDKIALDADVEYLLQRLERYEEAFKKIDKAIYTQHCSMNHMENTEHEQGQISGLIQASRMVESARKVAEMTEEEERERFIKSIELLRAIENKNEAVQ